MKKPYELVSLKDGGTKTKIKVGNIKIGGQKFVVMAGPCSIEDRAQVRAIAKFVKDAGATVLRGGAFKPRTSPYSFQGFGITVEELLCAAEYLLSGGNSEVILCERGIKTFETATRSTLDISAIPILKSKTHLTVIVDPSHAAGRRDIVPALSRAALAAGADGLLLEVHHRPTTALCDGEQALLPKQLKTLVKDLDAMARVMNRSL